MTLVLLSIAVIIPLIIGKLLVALCCHEPSVSVHTFWWQWWLAIGIGLGMASLTTFGTLVVAGAAQRVVTCCFELIMLWGLLRIRSSRNRPLFQHSSQQIHQERPTRLSQIVSVAFIVSLVFAIGLFILRSLENPHGEPDAWYLWNSCARFLFRSQERWKEAFAQGSWSHPDYPLLIPANVVRLWSYMGQESLLSPVIIAFAFTFATIGLLTSSLSLLRGRTQGLIGGLILVAKVRMISNPLSKRNVFSGDIFLFSILLPRFSNS